MRLIRFAALSLVLASCHAVPLHATPFARDVARGNAELLFEVDWHLELVGPRIWEYFPREPARPAVDPDTGRVVALTRDGRVRSVSPDGRVEWEVQTGD